jgi:predicted SpoU family rRNA methylase
LGRITVLRLGHRIERDQRISTHVALTARALGADEIVFSGDYDPGLIESVARVVEKWGGSFKMSYTPDWAGFMRQRKAAGEMVVHLTFFSWLEGDESVEGPWSSGYDAALTRRRSPVQIRPAPILVNC